MPEAVIVDAVRTPIGRAVKGSLKSVRADDLAAIPLKALLERNPALEQTSTGDVMMGCGFCEGEQGYNVGRVAMLLAGIDHHGQARAVAAVESGHYDKGIVPVTVPAHADTDKEGTEVEVREAVVSRDDGPRPGTTMEKLAALQPAFKEGGTVAAGNACPLNDGAA